MYCPQCGQQQISDQVRYCSRCGFLLEAVTAVLAAGGMAPRYIQPGARPLSPRSKGVRQGAMMMLSTLFVVPVMAIIIVGVLNGPGAFVGLAAVTCFVGGLLRLLYALMMEDAYPPMESNQMNAYAPPSSAQFDQTARNVGLPPASVNTTSSWRPRPTTSELIRPPSVTENTTRLLDKEDPSNR
ncbi:MAG: zinc ribbon domain-containing protein [Pyrinomonadaceae bacterium]|nr:zinc ribbon domain-containing protein [Pyrinomonadaceae bacterium]